VKMSNERSGASGHSGTRHSSPSLASSLFTQSGGIRSNPAIKSTLAPDPVVICSMRYLA